jgi:tRNA-modifying protein YgfZ
MRSPLLDWPGAVPAGDPDTGVAAHYGDPFAEQRALAGAAAIVDRSHRGIVRIAGPDRLSWLNSITTQKTDALPAGSAAEALILSPQGHVQHHLTLADDGAATWIHVEPGTSAALMEFLQSMRFMLRVEPADVTADHALVTLAGPGSAAAVAGIASGHQAIRMDFGSWTDLVLPRPALDAAVASARDSGATLAGIWAHEALRIAAHRPRLGVDTDHRTIPHEVGWIDTAVHLDKGCYRGQETVARVHNLGHPPRRLVLLHLDGSAERLPAPGDPVQQAETPVGFTGSSARHYELGAIALALVKRTVPAGATLLAAGIAAAQEVIVPPDAGANVKITLRRPRGGLAAR